MKRLFASIFALMAVVGLASIETSAQTNSKRIRIYLVALGDNGKHGTKIGCNDSLIPARREAASMSAPLKSAIEALLATPVESTAGGRKVGNFWRGEGLKLDSVAISKDTATIRISGTLTVAGICDHPRIIEQINATAKQFKAVKWVKVFVNGERLEEYVR